MPSDVQPSAENLRYRFLSDKDAAYIYERYPNVKPDYQTFCPTCHKRGTYRYDGRDMECDCQLQLQLQKHYLNAGIGDTYQRLDWGDFNGDGVAYNTCRKYVQNHESFVARGTGLVLLGKYGTGKTMLSNLVLKDLLKLGYSCYGVTFTQMVNMFTAGWNDADDQKRFQRKVKQTNVLLIDDLGKEMKTKVNLAETMFDDVLRQRIQEGRPTLITSNKPLEDIDIDYGAAIFSLLREVSLTVEVAGDDWRPQAQKRTFDEAISGEIRAVV